MINLLHAIGVLVLLSGFASFVIGVFRYFFPSVDKLIPVEFKKPFTIGSGIFITLAGMLLLKI
jgi:hypothetical protein